MKRRSVRRRVAAGVALVAWLGIVTAGDAWAFVSHAFGSHEDCLMVCCREKAQHACPRMSGSSGHDSTETDDLASSNALLLTTQSHCPRACDPFQVMSRVAVTPVWTPTARTNPQTSDASAASVPRTLRRFLDSLPSRAPPA